MWLIALATLSYALMVVALSRGPRYLDPNVVGAIVNLMGAAVPIAVAAFYGTRAGDPDAGRGVAWALAGGLGIACFTVAMTRIFALGGDIGVVSPVVYGGAILLTTLAGVTVFQERIGLLQASGLVLVAAGLGCIAYARDRPGAVDL